MLIIFWLYCTHVLATCHTLLLVIKEMKINKKWIFTQQRWFSWSMMCPLCIANVKIQDTRPGLCFKSASSSFMLQGALKNMSEFSSLVKPQFHKVLGMFLMPSYAARGSAPSSSSEAFMQGFKSDLIPHLSQCLKFSKLLHVLQH